MDLGSKVGAEVAAVRSGALTSSTRGVARWTSLWVQSKQGTSTSLHVLALHRCKSAADIDQKGKVQVQ